MSMGDMEKEIIKARHERIPVCGVDRDDIVGILYARDLSGRYRRKAEAGSCRQDVEETRFRARRKNSREHASGFPE